MRLPSLQCAETHEHYSPRQRNPLAIEAERIAQAVNQMKMERPDQGEKVYDTLVDQLISTSLAISTQPENAGEPGHWSSPQRLVWRSARMSYERRMQIINDDAIEPSIKAFAVINSGRWIVNCPFVGCQGAQYASFLDRRFYCIDCDSAQVGSRWVEVQWPQDVAEIEEWLLKRPLKAKNWLPGETKEMIDAQDKEND